MAKLTSNEYFDFDQFLKEAFRRVEAGKLSAETAHSHALHVLTAIDKGNETEVSPYMNLIRQKWLDEDQK